MKKNITLPIIVILVFLGIIFIFHVNNKDKENTSVPAITANISKEALSKIFSAETIIPQKEPYHYKINSLDYFAKVIRNNNEDLLVIVKNGTQYSSEYAIYSNIKEPRELIKAESTPIFNADEAFNKNFFQKDITGDGISEIFILFQSTSYGLNGYTVLRHTNNKLETITIGGDPLINFDEIEQKNGQVSMTSHSNGFKGKDFYELNGNNLVYKRSIGFFSVPTVYSEEYEVRVSDAAGKRVVDRKKGSIYTDNFAPYE